MMLKLALHIRDRHRSEKYTEEDLEALQSAPFLFDVDGTGERPYTVLDPRIVKEGKVIHFEIDTDEADEEGT
jgi:hypothetical protein